MSVDAPQKLQSLLKERIDKKGSLSVSEFMRVVLGHPSYGYYSRQDPFGHEGDFTTAPEISQMFGEMIGLWFADIWMQFGSPQKFILLECGPGRGTMMNDILRVTKSVKGFHKAAKVHLLENSPVLQKKQTEVLANYNVDHHENLKTIPSDIPLFFIANEFFDALPINQFQYNGKNWCERRIAYDHSGEFEWVLRDINIDPTIGLNVPLPKEGQILEMSKEREAFINELTDRIQKQTGAGLIIDYGYYKSAYGDTFQAVAKHECIDPLTDVGKADLTAHVNFGALKEKAQENRADVFGIETQGDFLKKLGIQIHASRLQEKASAKQAEDIQKALHRLTHSDEMGLLFKVMGIAHGENVKPAGF